MISSPFTGSRPCLDLAPHAKKYNTRYGSGGHNEHADLVEENLAIPGLRRTLVNHLEHGDLLLSRPLPRAWRETIRGLGRPQDGPSADKGTFRTARCRFERRHHFGPIVRRNHYFSCLHCRPNLGNVKRPQIARLVEVCDRHRGREFSHRIDGGSLRFEGNTSPSQYSS